jgi:putative hydrolase of the HAD superfamily
MSIKAIVFDLDDTLYKEEEYVFSGFKAIDHWLGNQFNIIGFLPYAVELFKQGERELIFDKVLSKMNLKFDKKLILSLVNIYRSHKPDIQLLEDASWVLEKLFGKVQLGLITDGYYVSQTQKIKALDISNIFDSIILSDKYGRESWKPSPIPYEEARLQLQCEHYQCVYVGDNIKKDFITAKKLGWKTIHVHRDEGIYSKLTMDPHYHAHYQINNLIDLTHLNELKHLFN